MVKNQEFEKEQARLPDHIWMQPFWNVVPNEMEIKKKYIERANRVQILEISMLNHTEYCMIVGWQYG